MTSPVRVRFAPSPTGLLHIGNARTALFNLLFARRHRGSFILRIEDTDLERSTEEAVDRILQDLRWLGISWDEGPDREGAFGPYRQSGRLSLYQDFAQRLLHEERVYKCFCAPERLEALRKEQLSKGKMPRYDGKCRSLTQEETNRLEAEGHPPVLRFKVGGKTITFKDLIHGVMSFHPGDMGDFIIVRSDGMAAYNFACVIDDHSMQISHVIRGEDHLSNTPRQIMIDQALRWEPPVFAHHPLILGSDRTPLSKRHGATAVSQYREEGFLPEALLNYLILLGWAPPSGEEVLSLERIIGEFSLEAISKSAPVHNRKKLEWLNSHYIRGKRDDDFLPLLRPYLQKGGISPDGIDSRFMTQLAGALKDNLVILSDMEFYLGIFFDHRFTVDGEAEAILSDPKHQETLRAILGLVEGETVSLDSSFLGALAEKTGRRGKALFAPLRASLTGMMKGPELARTLPLLGTKRIVERLKRALEGAKKINGHR